MIELAVAGAVALVTVVVVLRDASANERAAHPEPKLLPEATAPATPLATTALPAVDEPAGPLEDGWSRLPPAGLSPDDAPAPPLGAPAVAPAAPAPGRATVEVLAEPHLETAYYAIPREERRRSTGSALFALVRLLVGVIFFGLLLGLAIVGAGRAVAYFVNT